MRLCGALRAPPGHTPSATPWPASCSTPPFRASMPMELAARPTPRGGCSTRPDPRGTEQAFVPCTKLPGARAELRDEPLTTREEDLEHDQAAVAPASEKAVPRWYRLLRPMRSDWSGVGTQGTVGTQSARSSTSDAWLGPGGRRFRSCLPDLQVATSSTAGLGTIGSSPAAPIAFAAAKLADVPS